MALRPAVSRKTSSRPPPKAWFCTVPSRPRMAPCPWAAMAVSCGNPGATAGSSDAWERDCCASCPVSTAVSAARPSADAIRWTTFRMALASPVLAVGRTCRGPGDDRDQREADSAVADAIRDAGTARSPGSPPNPTPGPRPRSCGCHYGQPCRQSTGRPSAGPASAYPTFSTPASICFIELNDVCVPGWTPT